MTQLKILILASGQSQMQVGRAVDIGDSRLSKIVRGWLTPTDAEVRRLAEYLGVSRSVVTAPLLLYFLMNSWNYNAMDIGDETAKGLGVRVERVRLMGMMAASLVTSVIISFAGIIGFIGLVAPHIVRRVIGDDHRFLMLASILAGALILPMRGAQPLMGDSVLLISFVVVVIGGMGSFAGAIVGGLIVGIVESMMSLFWPQGTMICIFAAMALVILIKPKGLMGLR